MSVVYRKHQCPITAADDCAMGSVFRCDDCGRYWLKYLPSYWRGMSRYEVWRRKRAGIIPKEDA